LGRHPTQAWHYLGSDVNRSWKLIEKDAKKKGLLRAGSSILTTIDERTHRRDCGRIVGYSDRILAIMVLSG
jgi:hypothetical protein